MLHGPILVAALAGVFTIGDRTELRLRDPGLDPNGASVDFDTLIDAHLRMSSRRVEYVLALTPRFSAFDVNVVGVQPTALGTGLASVLWRLRHATVSLSENASYGTQNFGALAVSSPPAGGATGMTTTPPGMTTASVIPAAQNVRFVSTTSLLTSTLDRRRWTLTPSVGYQLSGGADEDAQRTVPLEWGPFGSARASYALTRRDRLATDASASETFVSSGPEDTLVELDEEWLRGWTRTTDTALTLGVSGARTRTAFDSPYDLVGYPVAGAMFVQRVTSRGESASIRVESRLSPVIDRLTGLVDERVQGSADASWSARRLALGAYGGLQESVDQSSNTAASLFFGEVRGGYRVGDSLLFEVGARWLWEDAAVPAAAAITPAAPAPAGSGTTRVTTWQGVVFLAVTVKTRDLRF